MHEAQSPRGAWLSPAAILLTALAATTVLLTRGPSCGHDFDFHLVSWLEVARAWHAGLLYPHWAQSGNYGAGEPRFVFYPPLTWMLGALLGCVLGWKAAPFAFTALCLVAAGFAMRHLAMEWLQRSAATAAACLYMASPYLLFVAYERTAYGELMAAVLLPLLLLAAVRQRPSIPAIAGLVALIWLANDPSGVMAGYGLFWLAALRLLAERDWHAGGRLAAGTGIGLALAGFYLVPAAYEERWVEIGRAIGPEMRPRDSFLFHHSGQPFHDAVLHTASLLACVLLCFAMAGLAGARAWRGERPLRWLATIVPLVLFLMLPISEPVWRFAPKLAYLQFPWRWLLVLSPVATLFFVVALARRLRPLAIAAITLLLCIASIVLCTRPFHQYCDDEDNVSAQVQQMHDGAGQEGTDEYTPRYASNNRISQDMPQVRVLSSLDAELPPYGSEENPEYAADPAAERKAVIRVSQWGAEHFDIAVETPAPGFAVLQLMDYPAWSVRRNGRDFQIEERRDDGLMAIPVAAGATRIEVRWRTTPDVVAGRALSLCGVLLFGVAWYRERRYGASCSAAAA